MYSYVVYLHFSSVYNEAAECRPCDSCVCWWRLPLAVHRAFITHCPAEKACPVPVLSLTIVLD